MITLISVRLVNFRAVKDATLSPLQDGVTGLSGPNGVGKSAFLIGTLWALYGELPRDERTSGLRNDDASIDDDCYVQVEFDHLGDRIIVTRSLSGKNNNVILNTWLNGNEATVRGVKVGQAWINKRLGVDAQGFTTAVLVKQKELDDLVYARPAERRALIERLSGISKMSAARKDARDVANMAKRDADNAPGDEDSVNEISATLDEYTEHLEEAQKAVKDIDGELHALRESYNKSKDALDEAKNLVQAHKDITSRRNHASDTLKSIREDVERAKTRVAKIRTELPEGEFDPGVTVKLRNEITELEERIAVKTREADALLAQAQSRLEHSEINLNRAQSELDSKEEKYNTIKQTLENYPIDDVEELKQTKVALSNEETELRDHVSTNNALIASLQESIDSLSDKDECPLCHQGIHDNSKLLSRLSSTQDKHKEANDNANEKLQTNRKSYQEVTFALTKQEERQRLLEELSSTQNELDDLTNMRDKAQNEVLASKSNLDAANERARVLAEEVKASRESLSDKRETLDSYASIESTMRSLKDAEEELHRLQEREISAQTNYDQVIQDEKSLGDIPTEEEIKELQNEHDKKMSEGVSRKEDYSEAVSNVKVWQERISGISRNLKQAEEALEAKKELLQRAELTAAVANTLDEFRTAQIARIAPELADSATNLISQMTRGRFTEVTLDENFTPFVVDSNGKTQPVSRLSGGELSVVALSLRIAIGDMLTGGSGGLLWLDEVLTAQDADRRASLMETLRAINNRQIVMINHTQGADDIVDRSIRLRHSDNGGTILDES